MAEIHYSTSQAARYIKEQGVSVTSSTMEVWRCLGRGPSYKKIGSRVYYTQAQLDTFLRGNLVDSREGENNEIS